MTSLDMLSVDLYETMARRALYSERMFSMHQRHWQRICQEQYEDIQRLQHALTELTDAVAGRALGDEPNVFEDYDELTRLIRQARAALTDPVLMAERALEKDGIAT